MTVHHDRSMAQFQKYRNKSMGFSPNLVLGAPQYETKLSEAVKQAPHSLGLPFSNWTTARLASYLG